jgi:hypothetical protein
MIQYSKAGEVTHEMFYIVAACVVALILRLAVFLFIVAPASDTWFVSGKSSWQPGDAENQRRRNYGFELHLEDGKVMLVRAWKLSSVAKSKNVCGGCVG